MGCRSRTVSLAVLVLTALLSAPGGAVRADERDPTAVPSYTTVFPSPPSSPSPSGDDLVGTAAGAGRRHPGRPGAEEKGEAPRPAAPVPPAPRPADRGAPARSRATESSDRAMRVLPLGLGLTLTGLGLAFFALRLRGR
ncbi:hypothetical protein AB0K09_01775 [Streptomyces sp. NPDC049577]|uniref:hypothetical protein n=1 Tax=Streptomyces sp. NPDC049577 TaxID=3155153 RepID=UPI003443847F